MTTLTEISTATALRRPAAAVEVSRRESSTLPLRRITFRPDATQPTRETWLTENVFVGWVIAVLLHLGLGVCLTTLVLPQRKLPREVAVRSFLWTNRTQELPPEEIDEKLPDPLIPPVEFAAVASPIDLKKDLPKLGSIRFPVLGVPRYDSSLAKEATVTRPSLPVKVLLHSVPKPVGGGYDGRTPEARGRLAAKYGGNDETERAVEMALEWLANHQRPDGSWRFNHEHSRCDATCGNRGTTPSTTGATGLALMPFLAAGYTHQAGAYRQVIARGLSYLALRAQATQRGADLQEGTMYAQGIAAAVLCESYALTKDENLRPLAQAAIDFIVTAQHHEGGWRYYPGQRGDMTVYSWQMTALRSAAYAGLEVPAETFERAHEFVDRLQDRSGIGYGYQTSGSDKTPTAIGLLNRMFQGWRRDDPQLQAGIQRVADWGLSKTDMYFNFYASQLLFHHGGDVWEKWNAPLREHLLDEQTLDGHGEGSWFFNDQHAYAGGRLYTTAICALMLEVYYQHAPLYGE